MKAIRVHQFGPPEVLKLEEIPDPTSGAGQVLIRVKAIGVNPVETYIRSGIYGAKNFPYVPGSDASGVVEAVGSGVKRFKSGDRVYTDNTASGAYAELMAVEEAKVHRLPANVTFEQGAALGIPYATAHRALFHRGTPKPGETLLVHGASGGVGTAAVQLARAFGLIVIGSAGTDEGRRLVLEQGAHHVLDHTKPDYLKQLNDLTEGRGVDLILEMLANVNLAKDLEVLSKRGRVVVVGNRGTIEINPRLSMGKDSDVRGMTLMNATPEDLVGIHAALVAGLENNTLRPIVGRKFPLADAAKAHHAVMEDKARGKIVLIP